MANTPAQRLEIGPFFTNETPSQQVITLVNEYGQTLNYTGGTVTYKYRLPGAGSVDVTGSATATNPAQGKVTITMPTMAPSGIWKAVVYVSQSGTRRVGRELFAQIVTPPVPVV